MIGTLETMASFQSRFIRPRRVDIWLPPGYDSRPFHRYPVLYMHDGQNLFEPTESTLGETWGVAETITRLARASEMPEMIVVGMWSTAVRWQEYLPQRPFEAPGGIQAISRLSLDKISGLPESDRYLRCIVEEIKPLIDRTYRTLPNRNHTAIMGSSMGGLISLYGLCEYPAVFGKAGCLSTHWPAVDDLILPYLQTHLPAPGSHRLYFDFGTETLDAFYEPHQRKVDAVLRTSGLVEGRDWFVGKFEGAGHNEMAWRARLDVPLRFLFGTS